MNRVSRAFLFFERRFTLNDGVRRAIGKVDCDGLISPQLHGSTNDGLRLVSNEAESALHDGQGAERIELTGKGLKIAAFIDELSLDQFSLSP